MKYKRFFRFGKTSEEQHLDSDPEMSRKFFLEITVHFYHYKVED